MPVTSSPTKSLGKNFINFEIILYDYVYFIIIDNHKKGILKGAGSVEAKTPQVENQEANEISVKTTEKSKGSFFPN